MRSTCSDTKLKDIDKAYHRPSVLEVHRTPSSMAMAHRSASRSSLQGLQGRLAHRARLVLELHRLTPNMSRRPHTPFNRRCPVPAHPRMRIPPAPVRCPCMPRPTATVTPRQGRTPRDRASTRRHVSTATHRYLIHPSPRIPVSARASPTCPYLLKCLLSPCCAHTTPPCPLRGTRQTSRTPVSWDLSSSSLILFRFLRYSFLLALSLPLSR